MGLRLRQSGFVELRKGVPGRQYGGEQSAEAPGWVDSKSRRRCSRFAGVGGLRNCGGICLLKEETRTGKRFARIIPDYCSNREGLRSVACCCLVRKEMRIFLVLHHEIFQRWPNDYIADD